jgi:hypothetical protein
VLVTDFDPAVGQVEVMAYELGRSLLNLYTNAFYAFREHPKREVGAYYGHLKHLKDQKSY